MKANVLLYFVKYPRPGKVKTRLARTLGNERAAFVYRELAEKNLAILKPLTERGILIVITFDPPQSEALMRFWLSNRYEYLAQQGEGLGERLENAFQESFKNRAQKVIAVGSDILGLEPGLVEEAFMRLDDEDVVLGPAQDGGYYLIGTSRFVPELFHNIPWSTDRVLNETLSIIKEENLTVYQLKELEDLDEIKER